MFIPGRREVGKKKVRTKILHVLPPYRQAMLWLKPFIFKFFFIAGKTGGRKEKNKNENTSRLTALPASYVMAKAIYFQSFMFYAGKTGSRKEKSKNENTSRLTALPAKFYSATAAMQSISIPQP